jgi:hypothetical protein
VSRAWRPNVLVHDPVDAGEAATRVTAGSAFATSLAGHAGAAVYGGG